MARFARLVVPGYPHHITQRGVRSMDIFASDDDRIQYLRFMAQEAQRFGVIFFAWCLMTNHVHLIAVPAKEDSLARAIGEAHRRYTRMKNLEEGVRGYLFQGRFSSCVLDQNHLLAAGRYVERNPVDAHIVEHARNYPWSSCRFNCNSKENDPLVQTPQLPAMVDNWSDFLLSKDTNAETRFLKATKTGRPVGDEQFFQHLEKITGKTLQPKNVGRPRKEK